MFFRVAAKPEAVPSPEKSYLHQIVIETRSRAIVSKLL